MEQHVSYIISAEDLRKFLENVATQVVVGREGSNNAKHEQPDGEPELATREEVCTFLHISKPTFHALVKRKALVPIKVGSRTLCDMNRIRADVEAGRLGRYRRTTPATR